MELDFTNQECECLDAYEQVFLDLAKKTSALIKHNDNFRLGVLLCNNEFIHRINKEYRNVDRPTDVISFAFLDDDEHLVGSPLLDLGEIIISIEKAKEQAQEYGHSFDREIKFLFVHGLLHLFGYDHQSKEEEEEMFQLQETILGGN